MTEHIIEVAAGGGYRVEISPGLLSDRPRLTGRLTEVLGIDPDSDRRRAAVITDSNVGPLYAEAVTAALGKACAGVITIPAGEPSKTPAELVRALEELAAMRLTRKDVVIALGGGVIGDLAGLAAALYMRGIRCLQIPTSLLAMVDSSVGGKTAVDLKAGKNLMGVFAQPVGVLIDPEAMKTLPVREISCGWGEIIKYGGLSTDVLEIVTHELAQNREAVRKDEPVTVPYPSVELIAASIEVKRRIVEEDEKESGSRRLLNLGHTVGHAVETASDYRLSHGASVAIGMHILLKSLVKHGRIPQAMLAELEENLLAAGLPVTVPDDLLADPKLDFSPEALLDIARHDKKSGSNGVALVLQRAPGLSEVETVTWDELLGMIREGL
ncbi:3-dehydroquinate synthase family protein [Sutterella sp.]|uniref:3-dehydroquinate synthase n=1 Tax=Sutterella sp. TaxID=1981025 RepID=UPI0026DF6B35|nr:3-dehydroquinate synthase family protein [Sutterella sp.]MDO5532214.1 3-dehydroquinate synthase family protein [Sutterella sp.]